MSEFLFFIFGTVIGFALGFLHCARLVVRNQDLQKRINKRIDELHRGLVD